MERITKSSYLLAEKKPIDVCEQKIIIMIWVQHSHNVEYTFYFHTLKIQIILHFKHIHIKKINIIPNKYY